MRERRRARFCGSIQRCLLASMRVSNLVLFFPESGLWRLFRLEAAGNMTTKPEASIPPKPAHLDVHCEDDVLIATIRGAYDAAVARHLEYIYVKLADRYGYRLALLHARETMTVTPEARRLIAGWNAARPDPAAGAIVGASFGVQTIAKLLLRAVELITRKPASFAFFHAEAEAFAWLDQQRVTLRKHAARLQDE